MGLWIECLVLMVETLFLQEEEEEEEEGEEENDKKKKIEGKTEE